jgi:hypothetical protein
MRVTWLSSVNYHIPSRVLSRLGQDIGHRNIVHPHCDGKSHLENTGRNTRPCYRRLVQNEFARLGYNSSPLQFAWHSLQLVWVYRRTRTRHFLGEIFYKGLEVVFAWTSFKRSAHQNVQDRLPEQGAFKHCTF